MAEVGFARHSVDNKDQAGTVLPLQPQLIVHWWQQRPAHQGITEAPISVQVGKQKKKIKL